MLNPSASLAMSTSVLNASLAMSTSFLKAKPGKLDIKRHSPSILYISASLAMSTSLLKALPGKIYIKRRSPIVFPDLKGPPVFFNSTTLILTNTIDAKHVDVNVYCLTKTYFWEHSLL